MAPVRGNYLAPFGEIAQSIKGVTLSFELTASGYGAFAAVHESEFRAVISNLLNNAYEAIRGPGEITVELRVTDSTVEIGIKDTGIGIPPAVRDRLFSEGFTYGKDDGTGRGLYHARKSASAWKGSIDLESAEGHGTTVTLRLPLGTPPTWFVPMIDLSGRDEIVVLDDDTTIPEVWRMRLPGKSVRSFSDPKAFRAWLRMNRHLVVEGNSTALFLVDLRLGPSCPTGLDVIESEGIGEAAILVTSDAVEEPIQRRCSFLGAKLLWKPEIGCVPLLKAK